jgi:hypothetical protein
MLAQTWPTLRRVGSLYARQSEQNPHIVASLTAGGILASADITAQWITGVEKWDSDRTLSLTAFGLIYYGGPCKWLYLRYDQFIGPGRPMLTMFVDVYLHTPFMLIPSFYLITGTLKGQSLSLTASQLRNEWLEASFGSALYWTPMQIVCFNSIPQHSRIAYITSASFFHKAWLSWVSNRARAREGNGPENSTAPESPAAAGP